MNADSWIPYRSPSSDARLRLFCFPFAGGGASIYRGWGDALPAAVEVCPVQLPGRERRFREPLHTRMDTLVSELGAALRPLLDVPFALFGHSMGALVGFELARELRRQGGPRPVHLFVSGHRAPRLPEVNPPVYHLPDDRFLAELRRLNGTPRELLENEELMELLLPLLRADMGICESYGYTPEDPLDVPVSVLGGDEDPEVPVPDLAPWSEETSRECTLRTYPGDHFFIHGARESVLRDLRDDLERTLRSLDPSHVSGAQLLETR